MDTVREEAWPVPSPAVQASQPRNASVVASQQQQQQHHTRIDLRELKAQMEKRLGPERARRYFSYLNGYLSQKLSKPEFDKLCLLTLGRENLPLHNRLIRSILHNACQARAPPPPPDAGRPAGASAKKASQAAEVFNSCNGDVVLLPGHGLRPIGGVQDHQFKDQLRHLGPNGRVEVISNHSWVAHDEAAVLENGALSSHDLKRSVRFQQCEHAEPSAKHSRVEKLLPPDIMHIHNRSTSDVADHSADMARSPVRAPLGIPFCSASVGGARKSLPPATSAGEDRFSSCCEHGELCHTEVLRRRMEKIAETQGLAGVTTDCADLLNNGLDVYLKNLIRSSVELIGARARNDAIKGAASKQHAYGKQINGVWLPNHVQMQSGSGPSEATSKTRSHRLISLQDFKVAMELNPQQLGEDWPVLLEKICLCSSEEND